MADEKINMTEEEKKELNQIIALEKSGGNRKAAKQLKEKLEKAGKGALIGAALAISPVAMSNNQENIQESTSFAENTVVQYDNSPAKTISNVNETIDGKNNVKDVSYFAIVASMTRDDKEYKVEQWERTNGGEITSGVNLQTPDGQTHDISEIEEYIARDFDARLDNKPGKTEEIQKGLAEIGLPLEAQEMACACIEASNQKIASTVKGDEGISATVNSHTETTYSQGPTLKQMAAIKKNIER